MAGKSWKKHSMRLTIDIPEDIAARAQARATEQGLILEAFAIAAITRAVLFEENEAETAFAAAQARWQKLADDFAGDIDRTRPALPASALSRENL